MKDRLLTYLKYGNHFCGIEHTTKNGKDVIYATQLKQSKRELLVEEFWEDDSIKDIAKTLPKNQSGFLVLNNDKILSKTLQSEQQDSLKLVYKAFPNINLDEFYYEVLSQGNNHFIALCRRDYIDNIINTYSELKLTVINISLGNTLIGSISNFVDQSRVFTSNARIEIENQQILQIEKKETISESYNINGLDITNNQLLSFTGALQTILDNNRAQNNLSEKKFDLEDDFKQSRFFNLFLRIGGLFILGLLLVNFFFFNHYFNKVETLSQLSQVNQSTKRQILKLNEVVSKKQKMVDDLLKSNGSKSSFYSNTIIHSLPSSILLQELNYQPLLKRIKADKAIVLNENIIIVEGESSDSEAFSNWINLLERMDWVAHVDIIDYGSTSSKVSGFKIELILKDD
ncbi:hypothetical protein [Winogradskyella sp. MIT101101]|uniref:hypothetical protein n=1 Tax=Winogradskyella sp. MIT101101 TaxID=3098297 RepID=UPI00399AE156